MSLTLRLICLVSLACFSLLVNSAQSSAETRRAFVVGITKYKDAGIQQLSLATQDAEDITKDLKEAGFDEKNVKLFNNPSSREAFLTEFSKFAETIKEGDVVFFYFSGHGFGGRASDGQSQNFLLLGDVKSPFEFARTQASDAEKKTQQLMLARAESKEVLANYETIEVPAHGISEKEILDRLEQKKPRVAVIVIDACRTLLSNQSKGIGRVVGTNLSTAGGSAPQGFMVIYSAAHGQQAIEKFGDGDQRRNSLFTSVFREYMLKPGFDLTLVVRRVRDKVSQIAAENGQQQDPDYVENIRNGDFYFVAPVGAERFALGDDPCVFANEDMKEIRDRPRRERLERHLRYFSQCPTRVEARQLLDVLAHGVSEAQGVAQSAGGRPINPCDLLAASEEDSARPPDVSGVRIDKINIEPAIAACTKAVDENPRVVRYLFNLARAYQRKAMLLADDDAPSADARKDAERRDAERAALLRYQDAQARGYVAALNNLATMYDSGEGVARDENRATELFRQGAEQGHPMAMYNLAIRYRDGNKGLKRDFTQAYEWFAKAAEAGNIGAMVQVGSLLWCGCGVESNPRRALEWLHRAANAGSNDAKFKLGWNFYFGKTTGRSSVPPDQSQALLWFAQAAESGDPTAQENMAYMFERGDGLQTQMPQIAERYWRLAAYGGDVQAQVAFADRILSGRVLLKPENGPGEVVELLKRAMTLGSSTAALRLARLYRKGEAGYAVRPEEAVKYAYRAIDLASQAGDSRVSSVVSGNNPIDEVAAGILLAEMAANGEAVNADGQPLLTQDERDRLERFYGRPDPETKQVKVRSLKVPMDCGGAVRLKDLWVWDWGREEAPTEMQFRYYETQSPACRPLGAGRKGNSREVLKALWDVVRSDDKLSFPDVVAAQSQAALNGEDQSQSRNRR